MVKFLPSDFQVSAKEEKEQLREKIALLGKGLVEYAKEVCPDIPWDCYVTGRATYDAEWGAVCPMNASPEFADLIAQCPNIYFDIPQDGKNVWVAISIEFKQPRTMLYSHTTSPYNQYLLSKLQAAKNAEIRVLKKEVFNDNSRHYRWLDLWDSTNLPAIDVSGCTLDYLSKANQIMQKTILHPDSAWRYEPVFLVKYEFQPHELVAAKDVTELIGPSVRLLAPIVEHLLA